DIVSDKLLVPSTGALHIFVTPDWRPVPHLTRAGYQCQTAYRLTLARGLAGDPAQLGRRACLLLDHVIRHSRDPRGGFYYAAPGTGPPSLQGQVLLGSIKTWWVQAEALKALLAVSCLAPENETYLRNFDTHWQYVQRHFIDWKSGGVYQTGLDMVPRWRRGLGPRFLPRAISRKGDVWKDASHDGRALLFCIDNLRRSNAQ
ncbi:MAG TPA: AGE family epimerase/isomerase, partial [Gemmatimonadales bacterium]|nr:AGE family epimerase/isomerase [Gemmatimonadales bacterium]